MAFSYNDISQTEVGGGRALPGQQAVAELQFGTPECAAAQLPVSEGTISSESRESLASDHPGRFLLIRAGEDAIELSAPPSMIGALSLADSQCSDSRRPIKDKHGRKYDPPATKHLLGGVRW